MSINLGKGNIMKKRVLSVFLILTMLVLAVPLAGCGRSDPYTEEEIVQFVKNAFGYADLVGVDEKKPSSYDSSDSEDETYYTFHAKEGFDYKVCSTISRSGLFGTISPYKSTNYYQALCNYYQEDILALEKKYNVYFKKETFNELQDSAYLDIAYRNIELSNVERIDCTVDFIFDYYELLKDHFPKENDLPSPFSYDEKYMTFHLEKGDSTIMIFDLDNSLSENTPSYVKNCALISYVNDSRRIGRLNEDIKDVPVDDLYTLYINGKKFTNESPAPLFYYDVKSGEYCLNIDCSDTYISPFGEIVTDYLGKDYSFNTFLLTGNYSIDNNKYKIKPNKDEPQNTKFYINGKKQDITLLGDKLDFIASTGNPDKQFMKLPDFAKMLNMDYTVNQEEGAVYLTSKE